MADPTGSPPLLIGIDVGGTKIAGAVIEAPREHTFTDVRVLAQSSRPARRALTWAAPKSPVPSSKHRANTPSPTCACWRNPAVRPGGGPMR